MADDEHPDTGETDETDETEDEFARFDALTRGLLQVPKSELDEKLEEWRGETA